MIFSPFDDEGIVLGQGGFLEADTIEVFLFNFNGGVMFFGGHLLIEDVLDIMGAIGIV